MTSSPPVRLVACQTVAEAVRGHVPENMQLTVLEFGLHQSPERLRSTLQQEIDRSSSDVETIVLGYGMCGNGTVGLKARSARLVIPRCDDCIALFLGSRHEYARQREIALGTFFLTRGWIEYGGDPYTEYLKMVEKYGQERALRLEKQIMQNYTRLGLIDMGDLEERHRAHARKVAQLLAWRLEEIPGSHALLARMLAGDWDGEFVVVEPGHQVEMQMFLGDVSEGRRA